MINFDEFQKVDLRAAKIVSAERVAGSSKLLKLQVEAGDGAEGEADLPILRQIIAGIGQAYEPESLIGKEIIIVANLEPRELMGLTSNGMLLAAKDANGLSLIMPDKAMSPGSRVG